jgi:hypothetical protein
MAQFWRPFVVVPQFFRLLSVGLFGAGQAWLVTSSKSLEEAGARIAASVGGF